MDIDFIEELAVYHNDPYGFVMWAFPWGEPGELSRFEGPEPWQKTILLQLGEGLINYERAIKMARASGRGIGKSALVSWLILWSMTTAADTIGVVTANTENQLRTKTWVQLAKWFRLFIAKDLFELTATALFSRDKEHRTEWRFDMIPWSARNTEAFQGLHNQGKRLVLLFDEASGIDDVIWDVSEGSLTDANTQCLWFVFGNPTKNKGRFKDCFSGGQFAARWNHATIDSREVSFTDKKLIAEWENDWGVDSDWFRVHVRGEFPRIDAESFISLYLAQEATIREVEPQLGFPVLLGVDVGRFGDDPSVIYPRKGRDGRSLPVEVHFGIDTMTLCRKIVDAMHRYAASFVFVDEGGVGGGVVDRLRQLQIPVIAVDFGGLPDGVNPERGVKYANKRAEIWGAVRDWLGTGAIPERIPGYERSLADELAGPSYGLNAKEAILLESKKDMRRRGEPSPNIADALACTFAFPVWEPRDISIDSMREIAPIQSPDYNPYELERLRA